jgi:F-type H+-transporting ATPase subunit epsilon
LVATSASQKLTVEIVTGERVVFSASDVDMVVAPGAEGQLGILPRHAPLFSLLSAGELRIRHGRGEEILTVFGGFLEVANNRVLILSDTAERIEDIDIERAEAARQRAEAAIREARSGGGLNLAQAEAELMRARVRISVANRHGRRTRRAGEPGPGGTPGPSGSTD